MPTAGKKYADTQARRMNVDPAEIRAAAMRNRADRWRSELTPDRANIIASKILLEARRRTILETE